MSHRPTPTIPSLEEIGPEIAQKNRDRAITRLKEAEIYLDNLNLRIERLYSSGITPEDCVRLLPQHLYKLYELHGEIKGLKLALGLH